MSRVSVDVRGSRLKLPIRIVCPIWRKREKISSLELNAGQQPLRKATRRTRPDLNYAAFGVQCSIETGWYRYSRKCAKPWKWCYPRAGRAYSTRMEAFRSSENRNPPCHLGLHGSALGRLDRRASC